MRYLIGLAIIAVLLLSVCWYFYRLVICSGKKTFLAGNKDIPESFVKGVWLEGREWFERTNKVDVAIKSHDKLNLKAWLFPSTKPGQKMFVIAAHGYSSRGRDMGAYAKFFNEEMDYNVLVPDARGHGQSDGRYIGFGWHDRLDYLEWARYLIKNFGDDIEIFLLGVSMGAATVLMLSGEELPGNIRGIISDCSFTSAYEVLKYQLKRMYGLPAFPIMHMTNLIIKLRAGYYLGEASALNQVKRAKVPIMFIHGSTDSFVPFEMVEKLYEACRSEHKKLLAVKDAGHGEALSKDYEAYTQAVREFIGSIFK